MSGRCENTPELFRLGWVGVSYSNYAKKEKFSVELGKQISYIFWLEEKQIMIGSKKFVYVI